jgi:hypothetical protein
VFLDVQCTVPGMGSLSSSSIVFYLNFIEIMYVAIFAPFLKPSFAGPSRTHCEYSTFRRFGTVRVVDSSSQSTVPRTTVSRHGNATVL